MTSWEIKEHPDFFKDLDKLGNKELQIFYEKKKKIKKDKKLKLNIFKKLFNRIKNGDDKTIKKLLNDLYKKIRNNKLTLNKLKKTF